jgi:hypothetical protein
MSEGEDPLMARWPKPPEGSWTEHFGLGTEPISYEDSIWPEFHELEREHLMYSMVMVSFPIECWGKGPIPDAGAAYLDLLVEPGP